MENKIELIITMNDYLPRLISGINQFVEEAREAYNANLRTTIVDIIDGLNWIVEAILLAKEEIRGEIRGEELIIVFEGMLEAMQNEDYILLTDLLEYEVTPKLEEWRQTIAASINHIV